MKQPVLVGDGAMGTMLQQMGLPVGETPEEWNISHPQVIAEIHRQYLEAGADVIETNTFGANSYKLRGGTASKVREMNIAGSRLAREMAGSKALVAGSVGPTGCLLAPWGELSFADAVRAYTLQAAALAAGGADFILIETMTDLQEARAAMFGAMSADMPVAVQLTFEMSGRTLMGTPCSVAAAVLSAFKPLWVGCNCGTGPEAMLDSIRQMRHWTNSVSAFPNAGLPEWQAGKQVYPLDPESFAANSHRLFEAGASLVGGCCGTTPAHIRMLRSTLGSSARVVESHEYLQEMIAKRSNQNKVSEGTKWVVGEESAGYLNTQGMQPGMFLASRTNVFPLGQDGVKYQLGPVGSIVNLEPSSWSLTGKVQDPAQVQIPIVEIPEDLASPVIASMVAELQIGAMPVVFASHSSDALKEALLHYCGRAGVLVSANGNDEAFVEIAVAMGALPVYR